MKITKLVIYANLSVGFGSLLAYSLVSLGGYHIPRLKQIASEIFCWTPSVSKELAQPKTKSTVTQGPMPSVILDPHRSVETQLTPRPQRASLRREVRPRAAAHLPPPVDANQSELSRDFQKVLRTTAQVVIEESADALIHGVSEK